MAMPYAYFEEQSEGQAARQNQAGNTKAGKPKTRPNVPAPSQAATAPRLEALQTPELKSLPSATESVPNRGGRLSVAAKARAEAEAAERQRKQTERLAELEAKRDNLIDRLDMGAARIQEARSEGKDVGSWEDFWLQLLRSYEQVCDELRDLVAQAE